MYTCKLARCAGPRFFQSKLNDVLTAAAKFGTNNILFVTITADSHKDFVEGIGQGALATDQNAVITRAFECVRAQVCHFRITSLLQCSL